MIEFSNVPFGKKRKINKLFCCAMEKTGNSAQDVCIGVKFSTEEEIRALNKEHRGVDKVTDVLSFPFLEIKAGQKLSEFADEKDPNGVLYLGDVVVCTARAKEQAKQYGHSYKRELMFLLTHGFLHCLGYDHVEPKQEKEMMDLTEQILADFGLGRRNV